MTGNASTRSVGTEASGRSEPKSPTPMGGASVSEVLAFNSQVIADRLAVISATTNRPGKSIPTNSSAAPAFWGGGAMRLASFGETAVPASCSCYQMLLDALILQWVGGATPPNDLVSGQIDNASEVDQPKRVVYAVKWPKRLAVCPIEYAGLKALPADNHRHLQIKSRGRWQLSGRYAVEHPDERGIYSGCQGFKRFRNVFRFNISHSANNCADSYESTVKRQQQHFQCMNLVLSFLFSGLIEGSFISLSLELLIGNARRSCFSGSRYRNSNRDCGGQNRSERRCPVRPASDFGHSCSDARDEEHQCNNVDRHLVFLPAHAAASVT